MAVGWVFCLIMLQAWGYVLEREQERICMHLATDFNWSNYRPIGQAKKDRPDLDGKKLEEKITWDVFDYCRGHITKAAVDEIRQVPDLPDSKLYPEFLKFDVSRYKTNDDLAVDPEMYKLR